MFTVTHKKIEKSFAKINNLIFAGALEISDIDEIDIDFLDTEYGFCIEENGKIVLGLTDVFDSAKSFENTLCHEMIHLFQIMSDIKVDHGKSFMAFQVIAEENMIDVISID